ncbi:MAG: septal ring lytic transglycosylase RlpA family protein [Pseudolabrys sp.]|jgi:rare lipoprotein A
MLDTMGAALASIGTGSIDFITYARRKIVPNFAASYRDLIRRVALMALARLQEEAAFAHSTIIGTVFTYNPFRVGKEEGGPQTASGEPYDPEAWTAAIKTDLRNQFRGVRYGRLYQPAFALVESGDKQLIVKINDVGPLRPGRVLDLNERSMRHFDPSMTRGLLDDVKITLLPGENWTPGPVSSTYAISLVPSRTVATQSKSVDSTGWQIDAEMRSGSSAGGSLHD